MKEEKKGNTDEEQAAHADEGQDQEPKQSEDDKGRSLFDTDQHSDAPGPFGTGEK